MNKAISLKQQAGQRQSKHVRMVLSLQFSYLFLSAHVRQHVVMSVSRLGILPDQYNYGCYSPDMQFSSITF